MVEIQRTVTVNKTPRVLQVASMFDVPIEEKLSQSWSVDFDLTERDWNVGLIVGPSGCGKTTVAKEFWPNEITARYTWDETSSVLDAFPKTMGIKEVVGLLTGVGFSSPPSWARPFSTLSNGEQFRVTIARALAEGDAGGTVVFDEFTSVVDRQVAKIASHTTQKAVRRENRRFVAVACHYDIIEWLQPDWIYQPAENLFTWRSLQRRPPIDMEVFEVNRAAWQLFSKHHYLSSKLAVGAKCYGGFVDGQCIAFTSYLHFPHAKVRDIKMGHRLVVLPDWQGLGIGGRLDDWLGEYLAANGFRYHNSVSHPAMIRTYLKSPRWRTIGVPQKRAPSSANTNIRSSRKELKSLGVNLRGNSLYSFEYVPVKKLIDIAAQL